MTPQEMYEGIARAESGVGLLWVTTGAGLLTGGLLRRALPSWPARLPKLPALPKIEIATPRLAVIMALALILRVLLIGRAAWYDEQFTLNVVGVQMRDLFTVIRADVHPPLFYLLEWADRR